LLTIVVYVGFSEFDFFGEVIDHPQVHKIIGWVWITQPFVKKYLHIVKDERNRSHVHTMSATEFEKYVDEVNATEWINGSG
jgi:hypothetical protein